MIDVDVDIQEYISKISTSFEKKSKNQVMDVKSRKTNVTSNLVFGSTQGVARFQSGHYAFLQLLFWNIFHAKIVCIISALCQS
jgi:hypothetical protein